MVLLLLHNMYTKYISFDALFEIPMLFQIKTITLHLENNMIVAVSWIIEFEKSKVFRCGYNPDINNYFKKEWIIEIL